MNSLFPFIPYPFSEAVALFRQRYPDVGEFMQANGQRHSAAALSSDFPSVLNREFPGSYGYDSSGLHKLADDGSGTVTTPRRFQAIRPGGLPVIYLYHTLPPRSADYWSKLAATLAGKVEMLDPCRCKLSDLRAAGFKGWRVYRAAKAGKHGKSAEIKTV